MREVLSISLSSELRKKIGRASKEYKLSKSQLVKNAIDRYLTTLEFRKLREKLLPYAEKKKYLTDEDIFRDIS